MPLADGNWQCATVILLEVIPPAVMPGSGPAGMARYGPCNWIFGPADEQEADARRAAEAAERAREAEEAEARHQQRIADNERRYGPAEPIRERIAAIDARLDGDDSWPEGEDWALAGLLVGLAGAYVLAARWDPSPVGGPPDWLPTMFLTLPGWALALVTALSLVGALAWGAAFLRRAAYPDPGLGGLAGLGVVASSFAIYLAVVDGPPGWVPSFLLMSPRWRATVIGGSAAALTACVLVYARYYSNQRTLRRLRAERDELRTAVGCGDPACPSCSSGTPSLRPALGSERSGDLP